jgi:hypothetical protein
MHAMVGGTVDSVNQFIYLNSTTTSHAVGEGQAGVIYIFCSGRRCQGIDRKQLPFRRVSK